VPVDRHDCRTAPHASAARRRDGARRNSGWAVRRESDKGVDDGAATHSGRSIDSTLHGFLNDRNLFPHPPRGAGRREGAFPAGRATVARVPVTVGITTGM